MSDVGSQAAAAAALLSAPVLRDAMRGHPTPKKANQAISSLVESGLALGASTVRTLVWRCDRWLSRHYRNDLFYRRAVIGQMSPWTGSVLLPEFRAGRSIVDFLAVSESLHAIEIKSDLDNISRLESQLHDYRKIAPFVSLMASTRVVDRMLAIPAFQSVGLHHLDVNGRVVTVRGASWNCNLLDSEVLMRSLRRAEYLRVLSGLGATVPDLPNTRVFSFALEVSRTIDPLTFHNAVAAQLRTRKPRAGRSLIARLPEPVRPAVLQLDPTRQQVANLQKWLNQEVRYVPA